MYASAATLIYHSFYAIINHMSTFPHPETSQAPYGVITHQLPEFIDQAADDGRRGHIRSIARTTHGIGADTSISENTQYLASYSEQDALTQTQLLLENVLTHPNVPEKTAEQAQDIYENLSFVGEKELTEATTSIAGYWKTHLGSHPEASIFVVTSKTFESEPEDDADKDIQEADLGHISTNKSDSYILDKILSNFSDEELRAYGDRLILSAAELADHDPQVTKTIVLDDWIMSGQQMYDTLDGVFNHVTPADLEINLVACTQDRLTNGFTHGQVPNPIPIKAYFVSRDAKHRYASDFGGSYLTAAHSTGDYPFEGALEEIVTILNRTRVPRDPVAFMPPLANIVRPYYSPDYHPQHIERLATLRSIGRSALINA